MLNSFFWKPIFLWRNLAFKPCRKQINRFDLFSLINDRLGYGTVDFLKYLFFFLSFFILLLFFFYCFLFFFTHFAFYGVLFLCNAMYSTNQLKTLNQEKITRSLLSFDDTVAFIISVLIKWKWWLI